MFVQRISMGFLKEKHNYNTGRNSLQRNSKMLLKIFLRFRRKMKNYQKALTSEQQIENL